MDVTRGLLLWVKSINRQLSGTTCSGKHVYLRRKNGHFMMLHH